MIPIPRRVLCHTATLYPFVSIDEYQAPTYGTSVNLSYVRFQPTRQTALTALGEARDDKLVMFYDCANSLPAGVVPKELDKVIFNSLPFIVRTVNHEYDMSANVHHYEAMLKGPGA